MLFQRHSLNHTGYYHRSWFAIITHLPIKQVKPRNGCSYQKQVRLGAGSAGEAPTTQVCKVDGKLLLLKTPHALATGHGEIKLALTQSFLLAGWFS